jgi:hypothetical protein
VLLLRPPRNSTKTAENIAAVIRSFTGISLLHHLQLH